MLDLDELLQSFGEDAPSGEDLTYDSAFAELEMASQPGEEKVVGDSVIEAEEPDYSLVVSKAKALLAQTKDLRVAVMLANAALRTEGLSAFAEILSYMRSCLDQYWASVHPQLDEDDDDDPTMRVNAVLGLTDRDTILAALRLAHLTDSRTLGQFSLRDILIAEGEIAVPSDMENVPTSQVISAAFQDTDPVTLSILASSAAACVEHVKAIDAIFDEKTGALGPDLTPLQKALHDITRRLGDYAQADSKAIEDATEEGMPDGADAAPAGKPSAARMGVLTSPEDVKKAIDQIIDYYARYEPSSPLPLLLNRARRLVSADFVTIMRDMAPSGVENVALIGGFDPDEND
ncbi:type VI secretion system protein TssA [Roseibium sp.]|uniref:type VI secretion system protein TssA n=1 Tax=Roseibium sp. TaxID=1936156 RepID=UPI003A97D278